MPEHPITRLSHSSGRVAMARSAFLLATLLAMACGGGSGGDDGDRDGSAGLPDGRAPGHDSGQPGHDSGQPGHDSGQPGHDSGQPGPGDAGAGPDASVPAVPYCTLGCSRPADCDLGSAPYDSDNYDCQNDLCRYTGCNSDAECQALAGNYLCRVIPGTILPSCYRACATPGDCGQPSAPFGSDNYACQNDVCVYTGCNSDAECQTLGNYVCRAVSASAVPTCQTACDTPSDCNQGSAPYSADNYDCQNNVCVYTGCNDDAECRTLGNYVCSSGG